MKKHFTVKFTDAYGIPHPAAVFELSYAQKTVNRVELFGAEQPQEQSVSVIYQFKYWHDLEALEAGKPPLLLSNNDGATMFSRVKHGEAEVSDLEGFCIEHLFSEVMPAIDPSFEAVKKA
ncbi:hypothetical protein [Aeromonas jandaei]|uniref:hypothetical protein n=1 Tax=Aeromonas jandaei TaxID=650 RepID=UPI002AA0D410|nr:hypothetical protein [Aeromonas jandaei]